MKIVVTLCFVSVGLFFQTELDAQNWSQVSKVIANDRAQEDLFGFYVSLDGNRAVIGAPQEDEDANGGNFLSMAGAAYVFSKDTNGHWLQTQKLVASDRDAFSFFGEAVAMNGNQLLIGSPREQKDANGNNPITTAGAVYVFERDETGVWMEIQKLVASDRSQDSYFGNAVAIEDERLIIGSFRHEPSGEPLGSNYGAAYVFEKIAGQWQEVDKLTAPDAAPGDIFGFSVGLSGDTILIGTYTEGEDENGTNTVNNSGSVYVYERTGNPAWTFAQKLKASDREVGDEFGYALSIINNTALISAHKDDHVVGTTTYGDAGSAYLFKKNTSGVWQESQKLTASDFDTSDDFAHSVSLGSGYLVIGARFEDEDPNGGNTLTSAGSAYIFEEDGGGTWQEIQKIVAGDRDEFDGFATLVAISGTTICLGAPTEDEDASGNNPIPEAGAAYFFSGGTLGIPLPETPTMTVWPNPTSREVWITFQQAPQEVTVTQMGVDGKHMASEVFYTTASVPFSLRGADGLYLLRVTASNGATQTVRIIKKQ